MKRPTQKDVARRAGVSRSTVSYVLNDQTELKVPISDETRQRVLEAIAELGYEPDARAQSLRQRTHKYRWRHHPRYSKSIFLANSVRNFR